MCYNLTCNFIWRIAVSTHKDTKQNKDGLLKAIYAAGYLLEHEVGRELERAGYQVQFNVNCDGAEDGMAHDVDIVATDAMSAGWPEHTPTWYYTQVVASCRASVNPMVFFARKTPSNVAPTPESIPTLGVAFDWPSKQLLEEHPEAIQSRIYNFFMKNDHRLTTPYVSNQFCVLKPRAGDNALEASQGNIYNEVLIPLIRSITYLKQVGLEHKLSQQSLDSAIFHPVIILRDKLYSCYVASGQPDIREVDHVVFSREYISKTFCGSVLIDVITRQYLEEYIVLIKAETQRLRKFFEENFEDFEKHVAAFRSKSANI
jgi:hypothetical protein